MENVGVMVPFLKVFITWHVVGFILLVAGILVVMNISKEEENKK